MLYKERIFTAGNGRDYILRSPQKEDAEKVLDYLKLTAFETEYGISYPEELNFTVKEEEDFIERYLSEKGSIMISVFENDTLAGNASLTCIDNKKKTRHRATFGIALLKSVWGQGIGYKVLSELIAFSKEAGYEQLELEVAAHNTPAIRLYEKSGFSVYGKRPHSFKLKNGSYSDELLMLLKL